MEKLSGKIAVITGATSGIGESCSLLLAKEGSRVILVGRNVDRGNEIVREINENGGISRFVYCDITNEESIISLRKIIEKDYGKLDILINNAGVFATCPLEETSIEEWKRTFDTNVTGCFLMTKHMMPMLRISRGVILNNASIAGLHSYASGNSYMYSASKAAVIQFTRLCAKNYSDEVRINCICPGIVDTPIYINRDMSRFESRIPMGRVATPDEIAKVVLFMVSDESAYITGAVLPVDGGVSI